MIHPGSKLGAYHINRELGRGGMALVYHAVDERNGSEVAIKVLPPSQTHDPIQLQRFQREGEIALRLRHPNIVRAHSTGVLEGYHYLVLDYAARGTLGLLLDQQRAPMVLTECVQLLRRVALALDYAHSRDVLHRDVKPSNILLGANGQVWLADFGIAHHLAGGYATLTGSHQTIGTPAYMSPEQVRHDGEIDERSDIYSLGVVAYNMLTGGMPFEAKTQATLLYKITAEPPTPPQKHNARLLAGTCYVLERVLAKEPQVRYRTAAAFIEALFDSPNLTPTKAEWAQLRRDSVAVPPAEPNSAVSDNPPVAGDRQLTIGRQPGSTWLRTPVGWLVLLVGVAALTLVALLWSERWQAFTAFVTPGSSIALPTPLPASPTEPSALALATTTVADGAATATAVPLHTDTPVRSATATPSALAEATFTAILLPNPTYTPVATLSTLIAATPIAQSVEISTTQTAAPTEQITVAELTPVSTAERGVNPTSTPVPELATDTPTPTATATELAPPTRPAPTAQVRVTPTSRAAIAVRLPTSTPIPELATDTPTATATATHTATPPRPTPTSESTTAPQVGARSQDSTPTISVRLLSPGEGDTVDGNRTFAWEATGSLPADYSFEPIFWLNNQDPMADGRGWGGVTSGTQLTFDLTRFGEIQSGSYSWGVLLVRVEPYRRVQVVSDVRSIVIQNREQRSSNNQSGGGAPSGGSSGGDSD